MKGHQQHSKKTKRKEKSSGVRITLVDRLTLIFVPLISFGLVVSLYIWGCIHQHDRELNRQMERWRKSYHLTEPQVTKIRELELIFHGNGNPFAFRGKPTRQELDQHHAAISQVMPPVDGTRFLTDRNGPHENR